MPVLNRTEQTRALGVWAEVYSFPLCDGLRFGMVTGWRRWAARQYQSLMRARSFQGGIRALCASCGCGVGRGRVRAAARAYRIHTRCLTEAVLALGALSGGRSGVGCGAALASLSFAIGGRYRGAILLWRGGLGRSAAPGCMGRILIIPKVGIGAK